MRKEPHLQPGRDRRSSPPTSPRWPPARRSRRPRTWTRTGADLQLGGELSPHQLRASATTSPARAARSATARTRPSIKQATPKQIWEAMITGPESMPVFGNNTLTPDQKRDVIKYIEPLQRASPTPAASRWAGSARSARVCSCGSSASARSWSWRCGSGRRRHERPPARARAGPGRRPRPGRRTRRRRPRGHRAPRRRPAGPPSRDAPTSTRARPGAPSGRCRCCSSSAS